MEGLGSEVFAVGCGDIGEGLHLEKTFAVDEFTEDWAMIPDADECFREELVVYSAETELMDVSMDSHVVLAGEVPRRFD